MIYLLIVVIGALLLLIKRLSKRIDFLEKEYVKHEDRINRLNFKNLEKVS